VRPSVRLSGVAGADSDLSHPPLNSAI